MIDVKVSVTQGQRLKSYNGWNKEMPIAVKGVGQIANAFQLPPDIRAIVPTGMTLEVPEGCLAKIYIDEESALKKALKLAAGIQIVQETSEIVLIVENTSDCLVTITDGDVLAHAFFEKKLTA